jgi:hypothetical protein
VSSAAGKDEIAVHRNVVAAFGPCMKHVDGKRVHDGREASGLTAWHVVVEGPCTVVVSKTQFL